MGGAVWQGQRNNRKEELTSNVRGTDRTRNQGAVLPPPCPVCKSGVSWVVGGRCTMLRQALAVGGECAWG